MILEKKRSKRLWSVMLVICMIAALIPWTSAKVKADDFNPNGFSAHVDGCRNVDTN